MANILFDNINNSVFIKEENIELETYEDTESIIENDTLSDKVTLELGRIKNEILEEDSNGVHDVINVKEEPLLENDTQLCTFNYVNFNEDHTDLIIKNEVSIEDRQIKSELSEGGGIDSVISIKHEVPKNDKQLRKLNYENIKQKRFSCDICNKTYSHKVNLTRHKMIHSNEKPFSCDFCDKKFTQQYNLTVHKRTHSGEKPFSCEICNRRFTQLGQLVVHKRIHTGEKPFSCDNCDKTFTRKHHLISHKRTHKIPKHFIIKFL